MSSTIPRSIVLNVCAAGSGVTLHGHILPLVCGKPPGHQPPHRDAVWPVEWDGPPGAVKLLSVPRQRDREVDATDP